MRPKRTAVLAIATTLLVSSLIAQTPTLEWAKAMGGTDGDLGYSITTDANGNVYTTGFFEGTVDFNPGAGTTDLISAGGWDIFVLKLDVNGALVWARSMGGLSDDRGYSITIDAIGNIYTIGFFEDTVDFDPGVGSSNLSSAGNNDIFIQKLDANGDLLWAKRMGGPLYDFGRSISTDDNGNIFTTGSFYDTIDIDPGAGVTNLISNGSFDIFIQKLDANGDLIWAAQMGGSGGNRGLSITTDPIGNVYTTGTFWGTADFDPGAGIVELTSPGSWDIFIQKLDPNGNFIWVKQISAPWGNTGHSITTDNSGNVYTTGHFQDTVDFDPGVGVFELSVVYAYDIFIQKLDTDGNFLWARSMGGFGGDDEGRSITTDDNGNVYTTGCFQYTVDFDPGVGVHNLTAFGIGCDMFVQKLDPSGDLVWVGQMGGIGGSTVGRSITLDDLGNIHATGYFADTADFDPGIGVTDLVAVGSIDIFVLKLGMLSVGLLESSFSDQLVVHPNPTDGKVSVEFENIQIALSARLLSISGQVLEIKSYQNANSIQLEIDQPQGIYILELLDEQENRAVLRIVKE